jgi:hypothetical protein
MKRENESTNDSKQTKQAINEHTSGTETEETLWTSKDEKHPGYGPTLARIATEFEIPKEHSELLDALLQLSPGQLTTLNWNAASLRENESIDDSKKTKQAINEHTSGSETEEALLNATYDPFIQELPEERLTRTLQQSRIAPVMTVEITDPKNNSQSFFKTPALSSSTIPSPTVSTSNPECS